MNSRAPTQPALMHRNLPLLLLEARKRAIARFRPLFKANGITEQQWRIVQALFEIGPLEPRQIVTLCNIASPSLAGVLTRMQRLDFVRRARLDHDQRRVMVSLTPKGRALATAMAQHVYATYAELEATVGPELAGQVYRSLDWLIIALGARPDAGGMRA